MIEIHKASERGKANYGWLTTHYSFSFADYYDPQKMGFGALRVLNDDIISPGKGFGRHPHDNMEIITVVLKGALEHRDSMGSHGIVKAGEVQRISAGKGITHSEFNASKTEPCHLLQIWVVPKEQDTEPNYEQKSFGKQERNVLVPLVLGEESKDALYMHQNGGFYLAKLDAGKGVSHALAKGMGAYVFVILGSIEVEDNTLVARDAAAVSEENVKIKAKESSEVLLIEVPLSL